MQVINANQFLIKRSELTTEKLFVEFYLPEYQSVLTRLRQSPYLLESLRQLCKRMFDGPFGSNRKVDMYQDDGIPYIRVKDVLPGEIAKADLTFISQEKHEELSRSRVVPGNVLLTIAGRVGTAAVFPDDLVEGNITGHIAGIEVPERINPEYLALFLNSRFGQFQLARLAHRTTRPELNLKEVGQTLITLPPRPIQDRIAQIMQDAYAERRAKLTETRVLLEEVNKYILSQLKINLNSTSNQNTAIKSIREIAGGRFDFEAVVTLQYLAFNDSQHTLLKEIATQVNERVNPASDFPDKVVDYIGLGNIESNTGQLVNFSSTSGNQVLSSSPKFQKGDILYGRMRPYLNKAWIAEFDGVCSGEAVVLRPNQKKVDVRFLHALLLSPVTLEQVVPLQSGTSLPRVAASDILNIKLPIPKDLDQQVSIGDEISRRRKQAQALALEAENIVVNAKQQVEHMILGEDVDP